MNRIVTFIVLGIIFSQSLSGMRKPEFGLEFGISNTSLSYDGIYFKQDESYKDFYSPVIGIYTKLPIGKNWSLNSGLLFSQNSITYEHLRTETLETKVERTRYEFSQSVIGKFSIPVILSYQMNRLPLRPSLSFGVRINRFIYGRYKSVESIKYSNNNDFDYYEEQQFDPFSRSLHNHLKRTDIQTNIGLSFQLGSKWELGFSRSMGLRDRYVEVSDPGPLACVRFYTRFTNNDLIVSVKYRLN